MTSTRCAIMKNEERYVLEWVAYHRLIGFDRIVIYENDSSDSTPMILRSLFEHGFIEKLVSWSPIEGSPQLLAYQDAVHDCQTDWIMFLDTDEFVNIHSRRQVNDFLKDFGPEVAGIAINWRIFGSAGLQKYQPVPVLKRFTMASLPAAAVNLHVKSFVRPACVDQVSMHASKLKHGTYATASAKPLLATKQGFSNVVDFSAAQINHYFSKSYEEYDIKRCRGNVNRQNDAIDKFSKYTDEVFRAHDRNDENDESILWSIPYVEAEVAKMYETDPKLSRWY